MRLQSAMEYLTTYGWAILAVVVVATLLFALNIFSPAPSSTCIMQAGFACTNLFMGTNGLLTAEIIQATQYPINITGYGCSTNESLVGLPLTAPSNPPSNQVMVVIGGNYTFSTQCYANGVPFTGSVGRDFSGYLIVNYTDQYTGLPHTLYGSVLVKVS